MNVRLGRLLRIDDSMAVHVTPSHQLCGQPRVLSIATSRCIRSGGSFVWATPDDERVENGTTRSVLEIIQRDTVDLYPTSYQPIACNPNLRVYKYTKGHAFGCHVDESNRVEEGVVGRTEMTMLVYLSECQGGATRFHATTAAAGGGGWAKRRMKTVTSAGNSRKSFAFEPRVGAVLLHVHGQNCLEHEADPVQDGIKYVLRTDLVFGSIKV